MMLNRIGNAPTYDILAPPFPRNDSAFGILLVQNTPQNNWTRDNCPGSQREKGCFHCFGVPTPSKNFLLQLPAQACGQNGSAFLPVSCGDILWRILGTVLHLISNSRALTYKHTDISLLVLILLLCGFGSVIIYNNAGMPRKAGNRSRLTDFAFNQSGVENSSCERPLDNAY